MSLQQIQRAQTVPSLSLDIPEWFRNFVFQQYVRLTQQTNLLQTAFQIYQSGSAALPAIVLGNANVTLTFTAPWPDTAYSASALPDWNTVVWFSNKSTTSIKFNFSVAAPGNQNLLVIVAR